MPHHHSRVLKKEKFCSWDFWCVDFWVVTIAVRVVAPDTDRVVAPHRGGGRRPRRRAPEAGTCAHDASSPRPGLVPALQSPSPRLASVTAAGQRAAGYLLCSTSLPLRASAQSRLFHSVLLFFFINAVVLFSFYRCIDLRSLKGKSRTLALLECSSVASVDACGDVVSALC